MVTYIILAQKLITVRQKNYEHLKIQEIKLLVIL